MSDPLQDAVNAAPKLPARWHPRAEPPPADVMLVWATDGELVWPIYVGGEPIPPEAALVRAWTAAYIPRPPSPEELETLNG